MPPDKQQPGEAQEERVRQQLVGRGYEQLYGTSDDEIRKNLGIRGKCADFVGYNPELDRWLIAESKGSDLETAERQLQNTLSGLLTKRPTAMGKIDLQVHVQADQYDKLPSVGLGGYHLRGQEAFLGNYDEAEVWHYAELAGIRVLAVKEGQ